MATPSTFITPLTDAVDLHQRLERMFARAANLNRDNIKALITVDPRHRLLDLGCDDGAWTQELGRQAQSENLSGVELVEDRVALARQHGIDASVADLADSLPYSDETFDVVHANQVIEHVPDIDRLLTETKRVLKPGGYALFSTENGSSWVNVFAAILGWQIFSLTNVSSRKLGIGNPMALHRAETLDFPSWTHKTIFNYRGLIEIFEAHGFKFRAIKGAGYFPLPASLGLVDPRHAHFLTIKLEKPPNR